MISQGLPSDNPTVSEFEDTTYSQLARGKSAMVKVFLTKKQNCDNAAITVTGGTVTVNGSSFGVANTAAFTELPVYGAGTLSDHSGDPLFRVLGTALNPGSTAADGTSSSTFAVSVTYSSSDGTTGTVSQETSRTISRPVHPLRVLVVPMGDARKDFREFNFPAPDADAAVHTAMQAFQRMFPLADGIGKADETTGGLRYSIAPSDQLVDLGPHLEGTEIVSYVDANGRFCGAGDSFAYIQSELAQARILWNGEHPLTPVDRVLGVVWQGASLGPSTDGAFCAEGWAGFNGAEAWARLVPSSSQGHSLSGSLLGLETHHTFGGRSPDDGGTAEYHSTSEEADAGSNRSYDTGRLAYVPVDESVMTYTSLDWHEDNTLLEAKDWAHALCVMTNDFTATGEVSTDCAPSSTLSAPSTGANGALYLAGRTDGTPEQTKMHTYVKSVGQDESVRSSKYVVRFFGPELLGDRPQTGAQFVPFTSGHSHHSGTTAGGGTSEFDHIDAALKVPVGTQNFELRSIDAATGAETVLYTRELDQAPQVNEVRRTPASQRTAYVATPVAESGADISPDGKYVAWRDQEDGVHIRRTTDTTGPDTVIADAYQPAWSNSNDRLAVLVGGSVILLELDTSAASGPPAVRSQRTLYEPPLVGGVNVDIALHPTWSPDDTQLAVSLDGDSIHVLDTTGGQVDCSKENAIGCRALVENQPSDWPAWSPPLKGAPGGLIAYQRDNPDSVEPTIFTLDPAAQTVEQTPRLAGREPAWGGGRLAYADSRGIATVSDTTFDGERRVLSEPGDYWPSLTRDGSIVAYTGQTLETQQDIYLVRGGGEERTQLVATDDNPQHLSLDAFVDCGGSRYPVLSAVPPDRIDGGVAYWDNLPASDSPCSDGARILRITDGYQTDEAPDETPVVDVSAASVGVLAPRPGDVFTQRQTVPLRATATGRDGEPRPVTFRLAGPGVDLTYESASSIATSVESQILPVGDYTLTVSATDGAETVEQVVPISVEQDADGDGIGLSDELGHACFPADPDHDPRTAVDDYDGDTLRGRDDPEPCSSAFNATVGFDPQSVKLGSSGTQLTVSFSSPDLPASLIRNTDASLVRVGGHPASIAAVSATVTGDHSVELKFDRQAYERFAVEHGLTSGKVDVLVRVASGAGSFLGADPNYPVHK